MELLNINEQHRTNVVETAKEIKPSKSAFIGGKTIKVELEHLEKDCVIPVFSKDNETTISHYQFIHKTREIALDLFPSFSVSEPDIRVSHQIKGRHPSAVGKSVKELLDSEKTIYYERCAFLLELTNNKYHINGNPLVLSLGGVRAYNQENLYSRKGLEKFKVFIGFQNKVCLNLCVSTDGFSNEIRVASVNDLETNIAQLIDGYNCEKHLETLDGLSNIYITEKEFAHFVGKARMYQHLSNAEKKKIFPLLMNDGQINQSVKEYYQCPNFRRNDNKTISLWNLYNLFTSAGKSSYIDSFLERNVNAYDLTNHLGNSLVNDEYSWFLHN